MTIGKKIKFLRKRVQITQNDLAMKSGIHPVSIRKYETNKMKPQVEQIEKIANALSVSPFALLDNNYQNINTVGDFYSFLFHFYYNHLILFHIIDGEVVISINPKFLNCFIVKNIEDYTVQLKKLPNYEKLTMWVKLNNFLASFPDYWDIDMLINQLDKLELELQQTTEQLSYV